MLCFSQNAVHVIRERLRQEIGSSIDALIAEERLIIRTFDSFATYMLADDLPKGLDYDQRIKLFIEKMTEYPDILEGVEYLIVDEVQDTIGVRARMLRAMIEQGDFGVLLSGDRCQAIYDWSIRGANDWISTDLYDWIGGSGFQICGLEENHRQGLAVSRLGDAVRRSLLSGSEEEQEQPLTLCKEKIKALWPGCKIQELPQKLLQQSELILCKTNGEAAVMSDLLFGRSRFVEHTMMQSANHRSLALWIGMILGGCTAPVVSKDEFTARAQARGIDEIETKWDALMSLDTHTRSAVLHRHEVLSRLSKMDALPKVCLNTPGNGVVVSTVHRAKGSEAEHVYWMDSPLVFDDQSENDSAKADALKASYVALTRARKDIRLVYKGQKTYMRPIGGDRWIRLDYKESRFPTCTRISQQQPNMNYQHRTPYNIDSAYISSLVTVAVQLGGTCGENAYQTSGCWLGYELGGFASINYT